MQTRHTTPPANSTKRSNAPKLGLKDLRTPGHPITCLRCAQAKPALGAVKFHSHWVCADCAQSLRSKD